METKQPMSEASHTPTPWEYMEFCKPQPEGALYLGARNEYLTHAYQVHYITGAPYLQIVRPLANTYQHRPIDTDDFPAGVAGNQG